MKPGKNQRSNFQVTEVLTSPLALFAKLLMTDPVVNKGDWLWSLANIKGANRDFKNYFGRSTTVHNLLFCAHALCINYVTKMFPLVLFSIRSKQLYCVLCTVKDKKENKNLLQRTLLGLEPFPSVNYADPDKKYLIHWGKICWDNV